jgi:hypothetical protein
LLQIQPPVELALQTVSALPSPERIAKLMDLASRAHPMPIAVGKMAVRRAVRLPATLLLVFALILSNVPTIPAALERPETIAKKIKLA